MKAWKKKEFNSIKVFDEKRKEAFLRFFLYFFIRFRYVVE